ncbi:hypothetical protein [Yunchengibacter salinarum]
MRQYGNATGACTACWKKSLMIYAAIAPLVMAIALISRGGGL